MINKKRLYIILILLLPALLLQGCWLANMPVYVPPYVPSQPVIIDPPVHIEQEEDDSEPVFGRFTIRYDPESTLNPIRALNRDNISITSLLYESLFLLNDNLSAVPLLCESWETEDNITFTFNILPDVPMHDGGLLTADDVAYSLRQARQRNPHRRKLQCIESVNSDGELTVTIKLKSANARFIRLLDVPIIREETIEEDIPPGTGPYVFPNPANLMLTRFTDYRDFSDMPLATIYLRVCNDNELTELFDRGNISLLWDDPASAFEIRINRDHEPRFYATTALQFLGFNAESYALRNPDVRRAIGCAVDRQYIVESIMNNPRPRQTIPAPVAISPVFDMYNPQWEQRDEDPLIEMAYLLERSGIVDADYDGILELDDGFGGYKFTLRFLVNVENSYKVAATEYIAECLRQFGFDVDVRVRSWSDFIKALEDGDFDLYYGEIQLGGDFDLTPLLLPGDGAVNYGKTANTFYSLAINNFLAAETQDDVSITGRMLCEEVQRNAPFIPILYKNYVIYTPLGVVADAEPSQSGVFYNFKKWSIDIEMLT